MTTEADWLGQARRLMEALRDAAAQGTTAATDPPPAAPPAAGAPAGAAPAGAAPAGSDCRWCPLCQAAAVVRGERPEVSAALADILTTTAAALRSFAGEPATDAAAPAPPAAAPEPDVAGDGGAPAPRVQRIELS